MSVQTRFYCDYVDFPTFLLAKEASLYVFTGQKFGCCFKWGTSSFDWTLLCASILIRVQIDLCMPPLLSTGQYCIAPFVETWLVPRCFMRSVKRAWRFYFPLDIKHTSQLTWNGVWSVVRFTQNVTDKLFHLKTVCLCMGNNSVRPSMLPFLLYHPKFFK